MPFSRWVLVWCASVLIICRVLDTLLFSKLLVFHVIDGQKDLFNKCLWLHTPANQSAFGINLWTKHSSQSAFPGQMIKHTSNQCVHPNQQNKRIQLILVLKVFLHPYDSSVAGKRPLPSGQPCRGFGLLWQVSHISNYPSMAIMQRKTKITNNIFPGLSWAAITSARSLRGRRREPGFIQLD